jgi:hypothetical protein
VPSTSPLTLTHGIHGLETGPFAMGEVVAGLALQRKAVDGHQNCRQGWAAADI